MAQSFNDRTDSVLHIVVPYGDECFMRNFPVPKQKHRTMYSEKFPDSERGWRDGIKALVAADQAEKVRNVATIENAVTTRLSGPSATE